MLKSILILGLFVIDGEVFPQSSSNSFPFAYNFLYSSHKAADPWVFHYTPEDSYKPPNDSKKRTEDYYYMHNGDNMKGTQDIFTGDILGSGWFKNFDLGKFATVVIEVSSNTHDHRRGVFEWSSKLGIFKLFTKRKVGNFTSKGN